MLFGSWLDKFKKPIYGYDIDIGRWGKTGQHGKIDRRILERWAKDVGEGSNRPGGGGASGLHPGVESGYQGGLTRAGEVSPQFKGNWWDRDAASRLGHWGAPSTRDAKYLNKPPTLTENIVGYKGGGILDKLKDKKRFEHIIEAMGTLTAPEGDPLSAFKSKGGVAAQGYTPTNMGAYVGDPVAMQAAIAEARRKKEKESLMNLLGGGY